MHVVCTGSTYRSVCFGIPTSATSSLNYACPKPTQAETAKLSKLQS